MEALRPERRAPPRLRLSRLLLLLLGCTVSSSAAWDLVLLHTNDVHARVEEKCVNRSRCLAGVARRATEIRRVRASESNVLLLDAGDQFQGTVWFNFYKGAEAAHFMNSLRYDAMALGNHEFDNGVEGLMKPFMEEIQCPVLSANIRPDQTLAPTFGKSYLPYKILTVGGQKVGVVGYTSQETSALSKPGPHLSFEDEVDALRLHVDKLRTLGVNKIIALGHSGFTKDKDIAKRVHGVDVVIGGHTNTFLYTGTPPSTEVPAGPYPFVVKSDDGRQVPVVQAYAFGKYLGYLKVTFDEAGNVVRSTGNPILLDSSVPQDAEVLADVEQWKKNLANYSAQVVGKTLVLLNGEAEECRFRECNLGNLICDAMVDNNIRRPDDVQWNHVSASIFNGGGVRASVDEQTREGSITMEDLISVLPFGGTFDLVQLRGSTLRKAFEHSVKRYGEATGEFLQVSGFHVEFDLSRPPGRRVTSLLILCTACRVPLYEPVEDETVYTVVLPSYMVIGGDRYAMIPKELVKHNSGDLDISVVSRFIAQRKKVYPPVEGRIRVNNSASGGQGRAALVVSLSLLWSVCGAM
ncbi:5'-nucleotidase [Hippoglossus hippoglossus]|uniref:5'-nucleotidase n=1 Tax=Hippoglossus hippoglossus TaxID=8267 RepID=UPI00148DFAEC|nr:5'-nucleotidase [Hippoglossus hippoglossus]